MQSGTRVPIPAAFDAHTRYAQLLEQLDSVAREVGDHKLAELLGERRKR